MTIVQLDYRLREKPLPLFDESILQQDKQSSTDHLKVVENDRGNVALERYQYAKHKHSNCPIKIFTLGRFSILGDQDYLEFSGNGQRKSLELLKALIAMGGREVGELRLSDALWPDSEGDVAHSTFAVTLHRLRKLMGPKALQLSDSRLTLNPKYCWVDVWVAERLCGDIKQIMYSHQQDNNAIKYLVSEITNLYHGPFLGNEDEQPWYLSYREKLHYKFLSCMLLVGSYLEKNGKTEQAIELYEKGLEIDELSEKYYLRLMQCYHQMGFKSEAVKVFERCKKILNAHLGIGPSKQTVSVFNAIQQCA